MSILASFDAYTIRARLLPAIIATAPGLAFISCFVSSENLGLSTAITSFAALVLLTVFADLARRQGKRVEPMVYAKIGGKPSISMLRYSDRTLDSVTKSRLRGFLAARINELNPSIDDELSRPVECDAFYERCGNWLREHTRDQKKFNILFEENMTYGFRRNLFGLKNFSLGLSIIVASTILMLLFFKIPIDFQTGMANKFLLVLVFSTVHVAYFVFAVSFGGVCEAARQYGRQLLLSCEVLAVPSAPAAKRKSKMGS